MEYRIFPAIGIARIGNSPKKLKEMVDASVFALDKIPTHIDLSAIQQEQVRAYNSGETAIRKAEIAAELGKLAKRHRLEILSHLLGMAQLEAEERLRLRSKRKLS